MATEERRKYDRRHFNIPVEFIVQAHLHRGLIKTINKDGVFIETEGSFLAGQIVSMSYVNPHFGERNKIGRIARIDHQGVWVKFIFSHNSV